MLDDLTPEEFNQICQIEDYEYLADRRDWQMALLSYMNSASPTASMIDFWPDRNLELELALEEYHRTKGPLADGRPIEDSGSSDAG